MVRDRQEAKKLVTSRRAAHRDKTSQIAGMVPDEEYISMMSAIACPDIDTDEPILKTRSKFGQVVEDEAAVEAAGSKPLSKSERRLQKKRNEDEEAKKESTEAEAKIAVKADEQKANVSAESEDCVLDASPSTKAVEELRTSLSTEGMGASPSPATSYGMTHTDGMSGDADPSRTVLVSSNSLSTPTMSVRQEEDDDGFASCYSTSCSVAVLSPPSEIDGKPTFSCSQKSVVTETAVAIPDWYTSAVAALSWEASAAQRQEGYKAYLYDQGHKDKHSTVVNPYILSEHTWWEGERTTLFEKLNARLAKEMRAAKTGSEEHCGTRASARTKENQKVEKFALPTNNRFSGLAKVR